MSLIVMRCRKSTCDFVWEGLPSQIKEGSAAHREFMRADKARATAAGTSAPVPAPPSDPHGPVVTQRWPWLRGLTLFNAIWLTLSTIAAVGVNGSGFWLFLLFPEVRASLIAPDIPVAVIGISAFASWLYAGQRIRDRLFWPRFRAATTMCGAISAWASAAVSLLIMGMLRASLR
jgi:hypothetical protein